MFSRVIVKLIATLSPLSLEALIPSTARAKEPFAPLNLSWSDPIPSSETKRNSSESRISRILFFKSHPFVTRSVEPLVRLLENLREIPSQKWLSPLEAVEQHSCPNERVHDFDFFFQAKKLLICSTPERAHVASEVTSV